jgi:hypothetical protein
LVGELLSGRKTSSNSADVRNEALEGTRALGWSAAMTFAVRDPSVKDAFKAMPEYEDVRTKTKLLRQDFDLKSPLLNDESMIGTVRRIDKILTELGVEMLPVEVMAVVLHYRNLALRARDVSLESLLDDLATIAVQDPQNASLSAYFIGRSMENVAVTTLLYQSDADRYPALAHSVKQRLNVMGIVSAQQQNARSDSIDENEKSSIDETIDITSSSSDSDRIDETRSDIDRKSKDLNELEGSFASSIQSLDEGSLSKAPIQSSLITSENTSFAEDYQLSSSGVNDVSQAQILNLERKSDVLQSTAEGIDPIIAFGGKKMRKKRAKTNNASAIMSATETSGERSNK